MSTISRIANAKKYYDGVMLLERMAELHTPAVSIAVIENYEQSCICSVSYPFDRTGYIGY